MEIATTVIAMVFLRYESGAWKKMPMLLLMTCVVEITGRALRINKEPNDWVYNIYLIIEAFFISTMYRYLISSFTSNIRFIGFGGLFLVILYIFETISRGFSAYNDITETVMLVLFICYGLYYYYLLIDSEIYHKLSAYPPFWWVAGTLFFCFGSVVSNLYYTFLSSRAWPLFTSRYSIFNYLNIILYGFWSYSFICRYRQRKSIA